MSSKRNTSVLLNLGGDFQGGYTEKGGPASDVSGWHHPMAVELNKEGSQVSQKKQTSKHHSSMVSASILASRLLV